MLSSSGYHEPVKLEAGFPDIEAGHFYIPNWELPFRCFCVPICVSKLNNSFIGVSAQQLIKLAPSACISGKALPFIDELNRAVPLSRR